MIKKSTTLPNADLLVIEIPRIQIEMMNVTLTLNALNELIEPENIKRFRDKLLLCVGGYDFDPREACEIPEIRKFMYELDKQWPYWFYFVCDKTNCLTFITFSLCQFCKTSDGIYIDPITMKQFMFEHFHAMNILFEKGLISETENIQVSQKIENYYMSIKT